MDTIDRQILLLLSQNARATASEIGRQVHLSVPAVAERIKKLEQTGIIEKYSVKINRMQQGYTLMAFVFIALESSRAIEAFRKAVAAHPQVLECHHVAGPFDYLLKVLAKDTGDLENFLTNHLKKIEGIRSSNTTICLSTLKEETNL